jgi:hypothetical protein
LLTFDPSWEGAAGATDWALHPSFPIFWHNIARLAERESEVLHHTIGKAGDALKIPSGCQQITFPDQSTISAKYLPNPRLLTLSLVGPYALKGPNLHREIWANPPPAIESANSGTYQLPDENQLESFLKASLRQRRLPLEMPLLLVSLVLLGVARLKGR